MRVMNEVETKRWPVARPGVPLAESEAVVWRIDLRGSPAEVAAAKGLVTEAERVRADRYLRAADRVSFLLQRAALRVQLAAYLGLADPCAVEFELGERGKPRVRGVAGVGPIEFNASGSGEVGLMVFSRGVAVGVDVERHREIDELEIARNFFSAEEKEELASLPVDARRAGFFNAWTRKEAFIKATGEGLYYSLERFAVSLAPGAPAVLRRVEGEAGPAAAWTLVALPMEAGYAAAVVRRGGAFALRLFTAPALGDANRARG